MQSKKLEGLREVLPLDADDKEVLTVACDLILTLREDISGLQNEVDVLKQTPLPAPAKKRKRRWLFWVMAEIFFLEHRNIEVRVDALNSEQIALELGTTRYILNPSEAIQVAEMLSSVMQWSAEENDNDLDDYHTMDEDKGEEPEWGWDEDIYERANPRN